MPSLGFSVSAVGTKSPPESARFSPDGQFLVCPHAFKRPAHIAVVMKRPLGSTWRQECDFVGHASPVVCGSFSPLTYTRDGAAKAAGADFAGADDIVGEIAGGMLAFDLLSATAEQLWDFPMKGKSP